MTDTPTSDAPGSDEGVLGRINELSTREHELRQAEATRALTADERAELTRAEVALDQCWDLLRQRRARSEFGQDPDGAAVRDADTVEKYRQ
jgi:hypothetical protein